MPLPVRSQMNKILSLAAVPHSARYRATSLHKLSRAFWTLARRVFSTRRSFGDGCQLGCAHCLDVSKQKETGLQTKPNSMETRVKEGSCKSFAFSRSICRLHCSNKLVRGKNAVPGFQFKASLQYVSTAKTAEFASSVAIAARCRAVSFARDSSFCAACHCCQAGTATAISKPTNIPAACTHAASADLIQDPTGWTCNNTTAISTQTQTKKTLSHHAKWRIGCELVTRRHIWYFSLMPHAYFALAMPPRRGYREQK